MLLFNDLTYRGQEDALLYNEWMENRLTRNFEVYLRNHPVKKLHLGCGARNIDGWFNTDINHENRLNVAADFPFEDKTFHFIYSEHTIEHLELQEARSLLRNSYRVLKRGGVFRITFPGFRLLAEKYLNDRDFLERFSFSAEMYQEYRTILQKFNHIIYRFDHKWMWDEESMEVEARDVGFDDVILKEFGQSIHTELQNIDYERRRYQSTYMELVKRN